MSETYLITAKTVEEAIAIANREYADETHEVSYEILEMPKKGFLGIGAKDAKIKITVTESKSADIGSLVADIRGMKILTDRGFDEKRHQKPENGEKKQKNSSEKPQNPNNNQKKQSDDKNPRDNQKKKEDRKPADKQPSDKSSSQKMPEKPAENKKVEKTENKPFEKAAEKPKEKIQEKVADKSEEKTEEKSEFRSSLRNQAKPNRHKQQKHTPSAENEINPTGVTVSAPIGVSSFQTKSEETGEMKFSASRMSNDVRKKKNAPKIPAEAATDSKESVTAPAFEVKEEMDISEAVDAAISTMVSELPPLPEEKTKKECVTQTEMDYALEFANTLLANMQLEAKAVSVECPEGEEVISTEEANVYPMINIVGDDTGILIGHHGETLDAIQYLVNLSSMRRSKQSDGDYIRIVVDIENYRSKREETLRALARRMAARAVKYKKNVFLEPMNAYERRIIHSELQNVENVSTHSVGSDRDRKIIITYEGADKQPDRRRRMHNGESSQKKNPQKNPADKNSEKNPSEENGGENAKKRHSRGRKKIQKMPIEKLPEFLAGGDSEPAERPEIED